MYKERIMRYILGVTLVLAATAGCASEPYRQPQGADAPAAPASVPTAAVVASASQPNFVLLISDEPNDIADFAELWVTISGIGFVQGDEEGIIEQTFTPTTIPLDELVGDAAIALWSGEVPEGEYTKIFIYVDEVWGILVEPEGEVIEIKLPSRKLQLDLPVTVAGEEPTEFVFDISVFKAGNSGQYILKPQITESGQGKLYRINAQAHERIRTERPEWAGKPDWAIQGGEKHADQTDAETPVSAGGRPDWSGPKNDENNDDATGRPQQAGRPLGAGRDIDSDDSE